MRELLQEARSSEARRSVRMHASLAPDPRVRVYEACREKWKTQAGWVVHSLAVLACQERKSVSACSTKVRCLGFQPSIAAALSELTSWS